MGVFTYDDVCLVTNFERQVKYVECKMFLLNDDLQQNGESEEMQDKMENSKQISEKAGETVLDEREMVRLISQYGNDLLRLCTLYLKDKMLAEDALQEVYLKVWKNYAGFSGRSQEKTWLTRIAINVCKNYLRSPWNRKVSVGELPEILGKNPDEFQHTEEALDLTNAILKLKDKYRVVILLYYYEELSVEEIAQILGCNKNTVLTRLKRGRDACKEVLKD